MYGQNYTATAPNLVPPPDNSGPPGSGAIWITPIATGFSACNVNPTTKTNVAYVNMHEYLNRTGIYNDGETYKNLGVDGNGFAYSRLLIGTIQNSNNVSFSISNASLYNLVSAGGQTLTLPSGQYSAVNILATGVNGAQSTQAFTVNYSDGSTKSFVQSISDWAVPSNFPAETIAVKMPYRNSSSGQPDRTPVNLYGYSFLTDATKTVTGISLPNNANVEIFAITLK